MLVAVIGGTLAWGVTKRQNPVYLATASILVVQTSQSGPITYQDIQASQSLTGTYASLATTRETIGMAIADLSDLGLTTEQVQKQVNATPVKGTQLVDIAVEDEIPERAARIANAVVEAVPVYVNQMRLAGTAGEVPLSPILVARRATIPQDPVRPSVPLNTALGIVAGLAMGIFVGFVRQGWDDRIREADDITVLGVPSLGVIQHGRRPRGASRREWAPTVHVTGSEFEDSFRQMHALLAYSLAATQARVLVITSASANEGKSTTALNLAMVMAESGKRVLLIDGDLRKPSLHQRLGVPNTAGLTASFLSNPPAVSSFVMEVSSNLGVLVAGPRPPSPAQVIGSDRLLKMMEACARGRADVIIVDTAPLLGLADGVLWLRSADAVLLVARSGKTRLSDLAEATRTVEAIGTPILGVVINDSKSARGRAAHYYER